MAGEFDGFALLNVAVEFITVRTPQPTLDIVPEAVGIEALGVITLAPGFAFRWADLSKSRIT